MSVNSMLGLLSHAHDSFAFFVWALVPNIVMGQKECTDRAECWPPGSSMHEGLLAAERQATVQKLLMRSHEDLVDLMSAAEKDGTRADERLVAALRSQQAAWLKYQNEECELVGALTGAGGSWPSTYASSCERNHTEQRLQRVRSALRCIGKIPRENRLFDQNRCLQQLAPLTNK